MSLGRHVAVKRKDSGSGEPDLMELIGNVFELSGLEFSADTVEDTEYGANEGDFKTYDYGLKDGGEINLGVTYKSGNTQAQALSDAFHNSTKEVVQLVFPADIAKKFDLTVLVTGVGSPTAKGEKIRQNFTLKVSGEPIEAAA